MGNFNFGMKKMGWAWTSPIRATGKLCRETGEILRVARRRVSVLIAKEISAVATA
jgi:hypothetical protein